MKILITGHKGFIGSNLWNALKAVKDIELFGFDQNDSLPEKGVDLVYHLAGNAGVFDTVLHPALALENVNLTVKVLEWMRKTGTKRMVYASSHEVYMLLNPYGASCMANECFIQPYCFTYGIGVVTLRLGIVYGKGNHPYRFIGNTIEKAKKNEDISIYGGEGKIANFIHIDDCVKELLHAGEIVEFGHHKIGDIGMHNDWCLADVAKLIIILTDSKSKILMVPDRKGENRQSIPKNIGNPVDTSMKEGLQKCL